MGNFKIAVVNSSSFGKVFPEHIQRLQAIGPVSHFRSTVRSVERVGESIGGL